MCPADKQPRSTALSISKLLHRKTKGMGHCLLWLYLICQALQPLWDQFETYTKFSSKLRFLIFFFFLKKEILRKKQNKTNLSDSSYWRAELLKPTDFLQLLCPVERYNPLLPFPLYQGLKGKECTWGVGELCSAQFQQRYQSREVKGTAASNILSPARPTLHLPTAKGTIHPACG